MCNPVIGAMVGTTAAGMWQSRRQQRASERANEQMKSEQDKAERERRVQALENRYRELQRQNQIRQGTRQIDDLFSAFGLDPLAPEGGFDVLNLPDEWDPNAPWVEGLLSNGGDFRSMFGTRSTAEDRNRRPDSGFFDERRQAFLDFATPQFERQLQDQREGLTFALTRAGLNRSSAAADKSQDLGYQANQARSQIAGRAEDLANQARSSLLDTRQNLMTQLQATGDPQMALAGAGERLQAVQAQPSFNPIGQVFAGITDNIGGYRQGRRRAQSGVPLSGLFNTGGSRGGAGSSRIVGGGG